MPFYESHFLMDFDEFGFVVQYSPEMADDSVQKAILFQWPD